jgi:glucokinase
MKLLLVGDIGGTNGRFGLVEFNDDAKSLSRQLNYIAKEQITLRCAEYPNMTSMIRACCAEFKIAIPEYACLALAGPIENGRANMTNLKWTFTINELQKELGIKTLHLINDFAAWAYAVPFLNDNDFITLYDSKKTNLDAPIVVMGPGTGFGMAILAPNNRPSYKTEWKVIPTEGGHTSFAPTNEKELKIKSLMLKTLDHVSIENMLSGSGLVNIYHSLAQIAGAEPKAYAPADVSIKGVNNEDPLCRDAVLTFCEILGSVAGDKALTTGAKGGVVICGGITPKILDVLKISKFLECYKNKGPLVGYVSDISIRLIVNDKAALVGSAAWLINHTPELH